MSCDKDEVPPFPAGPETVKVVSHSTFGRRQEELQLECNVSSDRWTVKENFQRSLEIQNAPPPARESRGFGDVSTMSEPTAT